MDAAEEKSQEDSKEDSKEADSDSDGTSSASSDDEWQRKRGRFLLRMEPGDMFGESTLLSPQLIASELAVTEESAQMLVVTESACAHS